MFKRKKFIVKLAAFLIVYAPIVATSIYSLWLIGEPDLPKKFKEDISDSI